MTDTAEIDSRDSSLAVITIIRRLRDLEDRSLVE